MALGGLFTLPFANVRQIGNTQRAAQPNVPIPQPAPVAPAVSVQPPQAPAQPVRSPDPKPQVVRLESLPQNNVVSSVSQNVPANQPPAAPPSQNIQLPQRVLKTESTTSSTTPLSLGTPTSNDKVAVISSFVIGPSPLSDVSPGPIASSTVEVREIKEVPTQSRVFEAVSPTPAIIQISNATSTPSLSSAKVTSNPTSPAEVNTISKAPNSNSKPASTEMETFPSAPFPSKSSVFTPTFSPKRVQTPVHSSASFTRPTKYPTPTYAKPSLLFSDDFSTASPTFLENNSVPSKYTHLATPSSVGVQENQLKSPKAAEPNLPMIIGLVFGIGFITVVVLSLLYKFKMINNTSEKSMDNESEGENLPRNNQRSNCSDSQATSMLPSAIDYRDVTISNFVSEGTESTDFYTNSTQQSETEYLSMPKNVDYTIEMKKEEATNETKYNPNLTSRLSATTGRSSNSHESDTQATVPMSFKTVSGMSGYSEITDFSEANFSQYSEIDG